MKCPICGDELVKLDDIRGWFLIGLNDKQRQIVENNNVGYFCVKDVNNQLGTKRHSRYAFLLINNKWFVYFNQKWNKIEPVKEKVIFT